MDFRPAILAQLVFPAALVLIVFIEPVKNKGLFVIGAFVGNIQNVVNYYYFYYTIGEYKLLLVLRVLELFHETLCC